MQRAVLRRLLSLPSPVLRLLAGGGAVHRGGRTLDPRLQMIAALSGRAATIDLMSPDEARRLNASALRVVSGRLEPGVKVEHRTLPGLRADLPARLYRPHDQDPAMPVMVFGHAGGGAIGDLDTCEAFCSLLARIVRCPVLSVDYALAPEHRFPAGLDDMLFAYRWARDNAASLGAAPGAAMIGGDSIGGSFAAVIAQDLKRSGEAQPALQLLIYPCVDLASETASMTTYAEAFPLSRGAIDWFTGHYLGSEATPTDPRLSPIRARDLSGLAPAVVVTAGFDPLADQGELYARALRDAGGKVVYRRYDSLAHGFTAFTGAVPAADEACREIARLVREALDSAAA